MAKNKFQTSEPGNEARKTKSLKLSCKSLNVKILWQSTTKQIIQ